MKNLVKMYPIFFSLLLLNYFLPKASPEKCIFEKDIDYIGQDLTALPTFLDSSDDCCSSCSSNENCQAWTFIEESQACYLKTSIGAIRIESKGSRSIIIFNYF